MTLRDLLEQHRDLWDRNGIRESVRQDFAKVVQCGTGELGSEVFASETEERVVPHTCKSRACPSCGYRATRSWQRNQWADLPEIPYLHVCLTMPDVLWPLFRQNRHVLHDLPVVGAKVLQQWAARRYGIRLMIVVVPHTFGRHLNFNSHLHILVSDGGLRDDGGGWQEGCRLDRRAIMPMWRSAVVMLLRKALRAGVLRSDHGPDNLERLLSAQEDRWWSTSVKGFRSKTQFLAYAGRYARRPPIAQYRFTKVDGQEVRFMTKDTRTRKTVETTYRTDAFLETLADHIPDRGRHAVRHFGLLASRVKGDTHGAVFALLGQLRRSKPARRSWAESLRKDFGVDPLIDRQGQRMKWNRRVPAPTSSSKLPGL